MYLPLAQIGSQVICWKVLVDLWQGGSLSKLDGVLEIDMSDTQDGVWEHQARCLTIANGKSSPQKIFKAMFFFKSKCLVGGMVQPMITVAVGLDLILLWNFRGYTVCFMISFILIKSRAIIQDSPQKTQALSKVSPASFTVQWYLWR